MTNEKLKVFGIRHHGPGSARALVRALEAWQPDAILLEMPADTEALLRHVGNEGLRPPVAALVYNPKNLAQAAFFPFAEFSPEWQALRFAAKNQVQIACIDLPMSLNFSLKNADEMPPQNVDYQLVTKDFLDEKKFKNGQNTEGAVFENNTKSLNKNVENDPMAHLAQLAGYTDSERWWEATFEQNDNPSEIFETILDMITALRQSLNRAETAETLYREAFMRRTIRPFLTKNYQRVAVVCGAWHAPILADLAKINDKTDADWLKKIPKTPTEATWTPWTYDRLARSSGYAAGISSPMWYEFLFSKRRHATVRWLTKAARLLRKSDIAASSANVIEGVRLAETLAVLRGRTIAGLDELEEAALTTLCDGRVAPLDLIRKQLVIGDVVGKVPPEIPQVPLQRDLEARVKSVRLSKEYATSEAVTKELDLRKDTQRAASHLLHRLALLSIPWGKPMKGSQFKMGSFSETWKLHWKADYAVRVIEAAAWGNTVEEATTNFVKNRTCTLDKLPELTELVERALDADLRGALPELVRRLQERAALTEDVLILMDALPSLVKILKYGNARKTDADAVRFVVEQLLPRIFIGLPSACLNTDDDATELIFNKLQRTHRAVNLLGDAQFAEGWLRSLRQIADLPTANVHGKLSGNAVRLLLDKAVLTVGNVAVRLRFALAKAHEPMRSAAWLEGFLDGSGLLLIHQAALWQVVDDWVSDLDMARLEELLPIIRRTFSEFSATERTKMYALASQNSTANQRFPLKTTPQYFADERRSASVLATLRRIL